MSAEYLGQMKQRFSVAYETLLSFLVDAGADSSKRRLQAVKTEFDAAIALVRNTEAETDWVRSVLAEHGYSGPLTETSCPLREWLRPAEPEKAPTPSVFTEYVVDVEEEGRNSFFSRADAASYMSGLADLGHQFTFFTGVFKFKDEWGFAQSMLKQGQPLSKSSLHALKLGLAAGMKIEL